MQRFVLVAFFLLTLPAFAQADVIPTYNGGLQLGMVPQYPHPGDAVTLTVANYTGDTDSTLYIWSVDGTVVLSGIGEKTLKLHAGGAGATQTVLVVAQQNGSSVGSVTALIHPADVDLVWEGQTTIPPLYTGRPLPNAGSAITVVAVPHITSGNSEISPDSLIYSWSENGVPMAGASGYGKSFTVVTPPKFSQAFTVSVQVQNTAGNLVADGTTTITPQNPTIALYENAPLLGVRFEKNITTSFPFLGDEVSFSAFPFFVGNSKALSYQWTLDGAAFAVDASRPRDVTFRKVAGATGEHPVTFSLNNPNSFLEHAQAAFNLTF